MEPLDLQFLEDIFVQFGHKNKLYNFSDNLSGDKPVAGCSGNIVNFVQKLSAYELPKFGGSLDTSICYKKVQDVTVFSDNEMSIYHKETALTAHEISFEADDDASNISIPTVDDKIELSGLCDKSIDELQVITRKLSWL